MNSTSCSVAVVGAGESDVGTSPGLAPVTIVLDWGGGGGGGVKSTVGISPAKADGDKTHTSATAVRKRFMGVFSFKLKMQGFLHRARIEQLPEVLASWKRGN